MFEVRQIITTAEGTSLGPVIATPADIMAAHAVFPDDEDELATVNDGPSDVAGILRRMSGELYLVRRID